MSLTGAAFLLAFLGGLTLALWKHPRYGLWTYVAVFYIHPPSRWWGDLIPDLRWSLLAAAVTLVAALRLPAVRDRTSWLATAPGVGLILFTVWLWIQSFWALDPVEHHEACVLYTKFILLYYLVYRLVDSPGEMIGFLLVHVAGCVYLGVLAYFEGGSGRLEGVGGPGIDEANAFAMQLVTAIVPAAMIALVMPGWKRYAAIAAMPFMLNGIVLSGSRSGFLALATAGLALWYFKPKTHRGLFYAYAVLGVVLFGMVASQVFWERIGGTMEAVMNPEEKQLDNSAESRFALVEAQMQMVSDYPMGTGHRGTAVLSPDYLEEKYLSATVGGEIRRRSSHSTFMSAFSEQGWPGAIWYIWMVLWSVATLLGLRRATRAPEEAERRTLVAITAGVLAAILVAGLFVDYLKAEVQIWFWALLAALGAEQRLRVLQRRARQEPRAAAAAGRAQGIVGVGE
ncbi:MAG TPA: O-antigen ligase family protein [Steroidobacteraceae bacterium]